MADLTVVARTFRVTVKHGKRGMSRFHVISGFRKRFPEWYKFIQGVWKMESNTSWIITFADERIVIQIETSTKMYTPFLIGLN